MKLTKYEQETIILYNQAENTASICTHDADLKRRFTKYSKKHPTRKGCYQGYYDLYLDKVRPSIRLLSPFSEEHRKQVGSLNSMVFRVIRPSNNLYILGCVCDQNNGFRSIVLTGKLQRDINFSRERESK